MTLEQLSGIGEPDANALRTLAVTNFVASCPLSPYLQFYPIVGNSDKKRKTDSTMNAGKNRAIGDDYETPITNTPDFEDLDLVIYGDEVNTDVAIERRGGDIGSQVALDVKNFSQSLGRYFTHGIINHTGASNTMIGLRKLADDNSLDIVFDSDGDGFVPAGNTGAERIKQQLFIEFLDEQIGLMSGSGQVIAIAPAKFGARMKSIAGNSFSTSTFQDIFGVSKTVQNYGEVPLVNPKYGSNGTSAIMPTNLVLTTEDGGVERTGCSEIILAIFGEAQDIALGSNVGLDAKYLGRVKNNHVTTVELDVAQGLLNLKALKRIRGIVFNN